MRPLCARSTSWLLLLLPAALPATAQAQAYAFVNGHWFTGQGFEQRTVYVADGVFTRAQPARVDSTYDLRGRYVMPPFGEAHNHNLDTDYQLAERLTQYLREGVFYAKMQSSIKKRIDPNRALFNHPRTVDVAFAHAPLTGPGGHPVRIRERFFDLGRFEGLFASKAEIAGHGYFIIDSAEDLEAKWAAILAAEPDFLKGNLLHSDEYATRKDDPAHFGNKGLDPALLPALVRKTHAAGLRLSVHVETAADFRAAVAAGVDEINHLPGLDTATAAPIRAEDARLAAEKNIVVVTTATLLTRSLQPGQPGWDRVRASVADNLRLLHAHGVPLAVGSDMFNDTSREEALFLHGLGVLPNLALLRMWAETAPRTIFPHRRIGRLADGYEASFLVLEGNPLADFTHVTRIALRFKQGVDLRRVVAEGVGPER